MGAVRADVENDAQEPEVFILSIRTLHMAALKTDVAKLRGRVREKHQTPVFMDTVIRRELGKVVASARRPALGELKLHPAHESPALNGIDLADLMLAPEDFVLPKDRPVDGARGFLPAVGQIQRIELRMQRIGRGADRIKLFARRSVRKAAAKREVLLIG